ncbi:MAG: response regulator [Spirochaetia bacterium]|jgi:CheY-like chemotaxis protein
MKRILVIEDDALIMNLIVILLEREGYEVLQSVSAEEGIDLAVSRSPDLVLMDVALPGLDGLAATRILKSREDTRSIPIIALTAQAMKEDVEKATLAGCDGFIVKPLSTRAFIKEISRFLDERARTRGV